MLSALSAEQLTMAITTGSTEMLGMVPGIGKKLAGRIVLELKEKIGAAWVAAPANLTPPDADVLGALTSLGYSAAEAAEAVSTLPQDATLSIEDKIKLALQYLGGR